MRLIHIYLCMDVQSIHIYVYYIFSNLNNYVWKRERRRSAALNIDQVYYLFLCHLKVMVMANKMKTAMTIVVAVVVEILKVNSWGNECFQLVAAASLAAAVFLSTAEFVFGYCICFRCSLLEFSLLSMNIYFIHTYVTICCVIPFQVMPISSVLFVVITTLIILAMLMHSLNFNWLSNRNAKAHSRHNRTA